MCLSSYVDQEKTVRTPRTIDTDSSTAYKRSFNPFNSPQSPVHTPPQVSTST
jgi:hypothetical protein